MSSSGRPNQPRQARVYVWPTRVLVGALVAISSASLPSIFLFLANWNEPPVAHARTFMEARLILTFSLVPFLLARLLAWICSARVHGPTDTLVIAGRALRVEVPRTAIERLAPWVLPLPGPGFWIVLRGGKRLRYGLAPARIEETLSELGLPTRQAPLEHPSMAYAVARQQIVWRWYHLLVKFVLFPFVPGLIVFRLHQYIAFGGPLGQYYLHGLQPYLETLVLMLATSCMDCILWASLWRALGEVLAFTGAWLAPRRARALRKIVEVVVSLMYYGGLTLMFAYVLLR